MRKWKCLRFRRDLETKYRRVKTLYMVGRLYRSDTYLEYYGNYFHPKHRRIVHFNEVMFLRGMWARGYRWVVRYTEPMKKWERRWR